MRERSRFAAQDGFSIIEVMVAALILAIGVAGTLLLINAANASTQATGSSEGATNLSREITERIRELPYGQLSTTTATTQLQAMSGLASTSGGPTWTVVRRGITYTINLDICAIDDPKDGMGSHSGATFCSSVGAAGAADSAPQDFERVTVGVSWHDSTARARTMNQVVMISGRGADGPPITALVATSPVFPKPAAPVVSSGSPVITFKATADPRAASVQWSLDGKPMGNATPTGNGTDWTFTLDLAANPLVDKTYEVAAIATDARGTQGATFFIPLLLNRSPPASPANVTGSVNTVYDQGVQNPVAEISWDDNQEANVIGYHVFRPDGSRACPDEDGDPTTVTTETECIDLSPQDGNYNVTAVYQDAAGNVSETPPTATQQVIANPFQTWWFKNSTSNQNLAECTASPSPAKRADLAQNMTPGGDANFHNTGNNIYRFCAPPLGSALNLAARNARVVLFLKNSGSLTCQLTASISAGSLTTTPKTVNVTPAGSTVNEYDFTWPISGQNLPANTVPTVQVSTTTGTECDKTEVHFNGSTWRSRVELPDANFPAPNPPTNVTSTDTADGTQLDWTAPASGMAVAFYRIYRDGYDYTDRLDKTDDTSTTWTDPRPGAGPHTYYVTSVASNLAESDPAPLPPATFP